MVKPSAQNYPKKFSTHAASRAGINYLHKRGFQGEKYTRLNRQNALLLRRLPPQPCNRKPAASWVISVAQTMRIAQKLYEAGYITYMRTDSVNLSDLALGAARKEILSAYGEQYSQTRKYTTKTSGARKRTRPYVLPTLKTIPLPATARRKACTS